MLAGRVELSAAVATSCGVLFPCRLLNMAAVPATPAGAAVPLVAAPQGAVQGPVLEVRPACSWWLCWVQIGGIMHPDCIVNRCPLVCCRYDEIPPEPLAVLQHYHESRWAKEVLQRDKLMTQL